MMLSIKIQPIFKTISCVLAGVLLVHQVAWAGDLIDTALTAQADSQAQTFAPAYLQNQQIIHETIINQHQDAEDLYSLNAAVEPIATDNLQQPTDDSLLPLIGPSGAVSPATSNAVSTSGQAAAEPGNPDSPDLNVTTSAGDIINYKAGAIDSIQKKDGTILRNIVVGENNNLQSAEILYSDGTGQIVLNGKVARVIKPDGVIFNYNDDERIDFILYPDGKTVTFSYGVVDTDGDIVAMLTDPEKISYYDADSRLKRVTFNDGKMIKYIGGAISEIVESNLSRFTFDIKANLDGTTTSNLSQYADSEGTVHKYCVDETGAFIAVSVEKNGVSATYNKEGALVAVIKDGGAITAEAITKAQADYDTAVTLYEEKKKEADAYQVILDNASADFVSKATEKDKALAELNNAIQGLDSAQSYKNAAQAEYDAVYNDYLAAQSSCDLANTALNNSKAIEAQTEQDLLVAQNVLAEREQALSGGSQPNIVSSYEYSPASTVLNQQKNFIDDQFKSYNSGIWYKPADSLVTIGSGSAILKGTGKNYNAAFYANQSYSRYDKPVFSTTFKVSATSGNFIAALDGYTQTGSYRRVGVYVSGGRICSQAVTGNMTSNRAAIISVAKTNTSYNLEFEVTGKDIKIYLWESAAQRPSRASYTYTATDWDTVRPYYSVYSGMATVDFAAMKGPIYKAAYNSDAQLVKDTYQNGDYSTYFYSPTKITVSDFSAAIYPKKPTSQVRTIAQGSAGWSQILARNQLVKNLNNAVVAVSTAKAAHNSAALNRQAKEAALSAASAALAEKSYAKEQEYADLQASIQALSDAQAAKDAAQIAYDSARTAYLASQTAYEGALNDCNNANTEESAAQVSAGYIFESLGALLSISSIFPQEDTVLRRDNSAMEAISIIYDAERRVKEIRDINGDVQADTDNDGLIDNIKTASGTTLYSYDLSTFDNIKETMVDRDGIKRIYDQYGNIKSLSLNDATKIVYENGQVKEIQKADGTTVKNMLFRDSGELDSALISYPDGSLALYNDAKLLQTISSSGDTANYTDGKICNITLEDGTVYDWSYGADGNIIIFDNSKNQNRTYREGKLIALEELAGAKLTTQYYYDTSSGNLAKSEVCQAGDVLYTYTYTYENELTLVHDVDGNTQAYTKDKKLSYIIDSMGRKYSYTYVGKSEGYIEVYFPSAVKARYDTTGSVIDITEPDGSVIQDVVLTADNAPKDFTYIKDGVTYKVKNGVIAEVIGKDGVDTRYYDNGYMQSVTSALGELTGYQYYVEDSISLSSVSSILSSATNNLSLYEQNSITHLTLSDTPFKFGTGVDGVKHVTSDETLAAGTYNFSSLAIDAGKTLKIASGAVINILGTASISGNVFCGGAFSINAYEVNVTSGASITGAVNIKCNTINNSGLITGNASMTGTGSGRYGNTIDDNFTTGVGNYAWGMSDTISVSFPSCDIQKAIYRASLGSYGLPAYASVYLCVNGSWTCIASYSGGYDSGVVNNAAGWHNVTGMMMTGQSLNGNCVSSSYNLWEMQAIIGTPTIEYTSGNPGEVNTSASRPTATQKQIANPASGSFESGIMELNAITLGSMTWSQAAPVGTGITFQTRTGDSAAPDATWTDWSAPLTNPDGSAVLSSGKRYIQYKATLSTTDPTVSPVLNLATDSPITFNYERAPIGAKELSVIDRVTVSRSGVVTSYGKSVWASIIAEPVFDTNMIDAVISDIPKYVLNDTQKEVYLRDSVIISELTAITSADGTVTEYCQGQISKVTKPDGTIITDINFDADNNAKDYAYYKEGNACEVKNGVIDTVTTAAGEKIQYYSYGLVNKSTNGESVTEYEYGSPAQEACATLTAFGLGAADRASFFEKDGIRYLTLSDTPFKFGTGVDGVKHVTGDETLGAGTYNFSSITVDAGKTLKIAPGAVINVLGTSSISGSIFCGGAFNINAYEVNVASGASITGAVNIRCNTINNSGLITGNASMTGTGSGRYGNTVDDNFTTGVGNYVWGMSDTVSVAFPSCDIQKAMYRTSLGSYGLSAYASVYLCVNGSWTCIDSYSGGYDSGIVNNTTGWSSVTGMMMTGQSLNGNCVSSAYNLWEMQAIIGTPTIEYTSGNPGEVNTSASRPTATQKQIANPASGSFESSVMELNALTLGSMMWKEDLPPGTNVTIQTRTGSTITPGDAWSDWSAPMTDPSGSDITSPGNKYFQYRINMSSASAAATPSLIVSAASDLSISYKIISDNPADAYVTVKSGGFTKTYNNGGINIADPTDKIDVSGLIFNPAYSNSLKNDIPYYKLSDAQKVITLYDQGNDTPVEIVTAGQSITYFDSGLATKVVGKDGTAQVVYTYDSDKNVINVEFVDARAKLTDSYNKAVSEIVTQRELALAKIDQVEAENLTSIVSQSASAQAQVNTERQRLTLQMSTYDSAVYDLSAFTSAFADLDNYQARLAQQTQDAYKELAAQVADARARIETDSKTAMADLIANDYNKILGDIVQKESSPIIYQYYRKALGRDPGESDLTHWTNKAKADLKTITPVAIVQYLQSLPEYADRQARKQNIITHLTAFLGQYIAASGIEKESMLTSIGLTSGDAITLVQSDIESILSWLTGQSLHFGDSAIESIVSMLKKSGINKSFEDIGEAALKVDIMTGVITKSTTGDLLLSMYAMRKASGASGLSLSSQKINYSDLKSKVAQGGLITHIDGKHYVVVTAVDDMAGTVTYTDSTIGQNGQAITITKAEFMETWKGFALSKESAPAQSKQLNVTQEKNIRGSGWWSSFWKGIVSFFQKIVAPIGAMLLFTPLAPLGAVLVGINIVIQTISFVVHTGTLMDVAWAAITGIGSAIGGQILPGLFEAAGKIFTSIGHTIFAPLQGVFSTVMPIFNNLSTAVSNIATGIGQIVSLGAASTEIAASIGYNIIAQGVSLGTDLLFRNLNLDPSLAYIGSALFTGAVMGMISPNTSIVTEAVRYGTIAGVDELGEAIELDPNITHLVGMMAGSLAGGMFTTSTGKTLSYADLMKDISPNVLSESAYIGTTEIGALLGVDPRISYLAGIGIQSSIDMGLKNEFNSDALWSGIKASISSGVVEVGMSLVGSFNPGISQILRSSDLVSVVGSILNNDELIKDAFNVINQIVPTAFSLANHVFTNIFDGARTFAQLVYENSLLGAINTAMSSLFTEKTVESVISNGGIDGILSRPINKVLLSDGRAAQEIVLTDDASIFLDMEGELASIKENGVTSTGTFKWTQEIGLQLDDGVVQGTMETGYSIWADIDAGKARSIEVLDSSGNQAIKIDPEKPGSNINMRAFFNASTSEYSFALVNALLYFANVYSAKVHNEVVESISQKVNAISAGSLFNDSNKYIYALANGIRNPSIDPNMPPQYIVNLEQDIQDHSSSVVSADDIFPIALYQGMTPSSELNGVVDAIKWLMDSQTTTTVSSLAIKAQADIIKYFTEHLSDWSRPIVGMGYSGGFIPLIAGVSGLMYNIKTIVGLGGPSIYLKSEILRTIVQILQDISYGSLGVAQRLLRTLDLDDSFIGNFISAAQAQGDAIFPLLKEIFQKYKALDTFQYPLQNTDLIVNVWGTEDIFHKIGVVDVRDNFLGKPTYNIEIVGAKHEDYIRGIDPKNPNSAWNNTVASFVTDLMIASKDSTSLQKFIDIKINQGEISPLDARRVYVVNLSGSVI